MPLDVDVKDLPESIGRELGPGEWHEVTQTQVDLFAEATGDHQWIHVDPERAAQGPFGGTIAHGYLTLSLLPKLNWELWTITGTAMGVNYGSDKVRFLTPVKVGARVRLRVKVLAVDARPDGSLLIKNEATVEVEGSDKPALIAQTLSLAVPA
jgi:acyl dehydratase